MPNHELRCAIVVPAFNRPDSLRAVLQAIHASTPLPVLISIDAPRHERDAEKVVKVLAEANEFSSRHPSTTVRQLSTNHGSAKAVPGAVTWALESYDAAIVLEDDCLPHATFFHFCLELLNRYQNRDHIMMISGNNFISQSLRDQWPASYYFSRQTSTWGWATWKRAWNHYNYNLSFMDSPEYPLLKDGLYYSGRIDSYCHLIAATQKMASKHTAWDSRWRQTVAAHCGLTINPRVNLVRNIGFGESATRTTRCYGYYIQPRQRIPLPLVHPTMIAPWHAADAWYFDHNISKSPWPRIRRFLWRVDPAKIIDDE